MTMFNIGATDSMGPLILWGIIISFILAVIGWILGKINWKVNE